MPHDSPDDGVPRAMQISGWACRHGQVTIELCDAGGKVFARAHMPLENYMALVGQVDDELITHGVVEVNPATGQLRPARGTVQ